MWHENFLRNTAKTVITFIDEPYLSALGSAFISIPDRLVTDMLAVVLSGLSGIRGIHCCGATNWSVLLKLPIDILSFDAFNYYDSLSCYENDVIEFLENGGNIAWGIVPNDPELFVKETPSTIIDRLGEAISPFTFGKISYKQILEQSLFTPSCGLENIDEALIPDILQLLKQIATKLKSKIS